MQWVLFFSLLVALFYFQAGLYLLWKNPEAKFNRWFFGLTVYFGFWSLTLSFTYLPVFEPHVACWELIVLIGLSLLPYMLVRFFALLTTLPDKNHRLWNRGLLLPGLVFLLVFVVEFLLLLLAGDDGDRHLVFELATYLLYLMMIIAGSRLFGMLGRWQRGLQRTGERKQYQLAFYTLLLAIFFMLWFDYLLPAFAESAHLKLPHMYFFPLFFGLTFGYLKYHLYSPLPSESARRLMEELQQLVFFCDEEGRIVYANTFSIELMRREHGEVRGSSLVDFFENEVALEKLIRRGRHTGHSGPLEMHMRTSGGDVIPVNLYCAELSDKFDDSHGIVIYGEDMRSALALEEEVRQRILMEETIRNESKALEAETENRTREVARSVREAQQRMTERVQAEEAIKIEIAEMEVMLEEIHHRVKKNLRIFLSLIGTSVEPEKIPHEFNSLADLHQRIHALLMVHEHASPEINYSNVNFKGFLSGLADRFDHLFGIDAKGDSCFSIRAEEILLPADQALPLGLVINELFSYICNCNHATNKKRGKGHGHNSEIELNLWKDKKNQCCLLISFPEFSWPEIHPETVHGCQEIQLARMLVEEQLSGEFHLEKEAGFRLRISFPFHIPRREVYHYHIH